MNDIKLNNGNYIPCIGYGTSIVSDPNRPFIKRCVSYAKNCIKNKHQNYLNSNINKMIIASKNCGGGLLDTSRAYGGSEACIGNVMEKEGRGKFFVCTKISNYYQLNNNVDKCIEESLSKLKTDYIDLLLLHWPVTDKYVESYKILEKYYTKGTVKNIGVSNFNIHHLEEIKLKCSVKPVVNEIECHPLFTQEKLREYCKGEQIQVIAYTPTARMDSRYNNTCLYELSKKYKKSLTQIILRWHLQIGNIPIVNTSNKKHLIDNFNIFDFKLENQDIIKISNININSRLRYDPDNCDFTKL